MRCYIRFCVMLHASLYRYSFYYASHVQCTLICGGSGGSALRCCWFESHPGSCRHNVGWPVFPLVLAGSQIIIIKGTKWPCLILSSMNCIYCFSLVAKCIHLWLHQPNAALLKDLGFSLYNILLDLALVFCVLYIKKLNRDRFRGYNYYHKVNKA